MEINRLISREVARRQRIGRNGAIKKRALKGVPIELRCQRCGHAMDEFHLITFYDARNTPNYRTCFECYDKTDVRKRYFYGELG